MSKSQYDYDPRTKLLLVLCISSIAVFFQNIFILALSLIVTLLFCFFFTTNINGTLGKIKYFIKIVFIIAVIQSIFTNAGTVIIEIKGFNLLTTGGLIKSIEFVLRIMIIIISASILTTCSSRKMVRAFEKLGFAYEIAFMVCVGVRFLPVFTQEIKDVFIAIQLRGIDIERLSLKEKLKLYSYLFTPVIAGAFIKAKNMSLAMETKAFRAYPCRTSYIDIVLNKKDYILMSITVVLTISIIISYYLFFSKLI